MTSCCHHSYTIPSLLASCCSSMPDKIMNTAAPTNTTMNTPPAIHVDILTAILLANCHCRCHLISSYQQSVKTTNRSTDELSLGSLLLPFYQERQEYGKERAQREMVYPSHYSGIGWETLAPRFHSKYRERSVTLV